MRLGGPARFMVEVRSSAEVAQIVADAQSKQIPLWVLGGGSNTIARDEGFNGLVLRVRIPGFEIIEDTLDHTTIKVGAGEDWDGFVKRTVEMNLVGIEALSAIPGTVGASPVQNVGAYGQEISDTMVSLEAYDTQTRQLVSLTNEQCAFGYRNSIFKQDAKGRYIITSVTFRLLKTLPAPPFYDALQRYLDEHSIGIFTAQIIRDAVMQIRANKLPDPKQLPNSGSFFKNAMVETWQLNNLQTQFPDLPNYDMGNGQYKIPTGWLIERTGLKGQVIHGIKIHDGNALVLINESASGYGDLASARGAIQQAVREKFGIQIEQEPLEI